MVPTSWVRINKVICEVLKTISGITVLNKCYSKMLTITIIVTVLLVSFYFVFVIIIVHFESLKSKSVSVQFFRIQSLRKGPT